jgi:hypothetical protein
MENLIKPYANGDREIIAEGNGSFMCSVIGHEWQEIEDHRPIQMVSTYHASYPETWQCSRCGRIFQQTVTAML